MKAAIVAILLGACAAPEYATSMPECLTGVVQASKEEKVIADVDNTGPYYVTRFVRQVQMDDGRIMYVHGMGPGQGDRIRICAYAPRGWMLKQDHLFPSMKGEEGIYQLTAEVEK